MEQLKYGKTYECLSTLKQDDSVNSILQLRNKEVLVSACSGYYSSPSPGVSFWNLNDYTHQQSIKGYGIAWFTRMIELSNGDIALSSKDKPHPIVIIDSLSYRVKKEILLQEYITKCSSLFMFNEHSFIYAYGGTFLEISNEDSSIVFRSEKGRFRGYYDIIPLKGGKYFALASGERISIIKLCYA